MAKTITIKQLKKGFKKAPQTIQMEGKKFLQRGLSEYARIVQRSPWRVGQDGGGVPVDMGELRRSHGMEIKGLTGRYGIIRGKVRPLNYDIYVHEGTRHMERRPWLDFAQKKADARIKVHYRRFMDEVLKVIAS